MRPASRSDWNRSLAGAVPAYMPIALCLHRRGEALQSPLPDTRAVPPHRLAPVVPLYPYVHARRALVPLRGRARCGAAPQPVSPLP